MRVLATGIFDLLHVEHVRFLAAAKTVSLGDIFSVRSARDPRSLRRRPPVVSKTQVLVGSSSMTSKMSPSTYLIVGIESDKRVRRLKGKGRPVMGQEDRKEMLEGLKMVDEVMILPEDFDNDEQYEKLLKDLKIGVYAVSENSPYFENKKRICRRAGVKCVVVRKFNPEYSTSKLIHKLLNEQK